MEAQQEKRTGTAHVGCNKRPRVSPAEVALHQAMPRSDGGTASITSDDSVLRMLKQAAEASGRDEGESEVNEAIASSHDDSDGESVLIHLERAVLSLEQLSQKRKAQRAMYKSSTRELSLELSALSMDLAASSRTEAADATRKLHTARRELEQTRIADAAAKLDAEKENQAVQSELPLLRKGLEMSKLKLKETEAELAGWGKDRVRELKEQHARELDAKDEITQRRGQVHDLLLETCLRQNQRKQWWNNLHAEYLEMKEECSRMRKSELLKAEKAALETELQNSSIAARRNANSLAELYASMKNWILLDADEVRNKRPAGPGDTWEAAELCRLWDTYSFDDNLQNLQAEMFIQGDIRSKDNNFDPNWLFGDVDLRSQLWKINHQPAAGGDSWMRPRLGAEKWLESTSNLVAEDAAFWLKRRRQAMSELRRLCDSVNAQQEQCTRLEPLLDRVRKALDDDDCVQFDRQYLESIRAS